MPSSSPRPTEQSEKLQRRAEALLPGGVDSPVRAFRAVGGASAVCGKRCRRVPHGCGRQSLRGPVRLLGADAAGTRLPSRGRSDSRGGREERLVWCEHSSGKRAGRVGPSAAFLRWRNCGLCRRAQKPACRPSGWREDSPGGPFVIKFEGCYHGHADALLVKAGSGLATFGIPGSAGVPPETAMHTLALPYNDLAAVEAAFDGHPGQVACVILEPVVGNAGTILPADGYLAGLRVLTRKHGALLIFDEVMTGFRLAPRRSAGDVRFCQRRRCA